MSKLLFLFTVLTIVSMGHALLGGNKCPILRPISPDCCFMTDVNHERAKGSGPLHLSPFLLNLVSANQKPLNHFEQTNKTSLWKLTPLKEDENGKQIEGGPIRMQVNYFYIQDLILKSKPIYYHWKKFIREQHRCRKSKESRYISSVFLFVFSPPLS